MPRIEDECRELEQQIDDLADLMADSTEILVKDTPVVARLNAIHGKVARLSEWNAHVKRSAQAILDVVRINPILCGYDTEKITQLAEEMILW